MRECVGGREIEPDHQVGGPASGGGGVLGCGDHEVPLDFVDTLNCPSDPGCCRDATQEMASRTGPGACVRADICLDRERVT